MIRSLRLWFRALFSRRSVENELSREMLSHIAMAADRMTRDGIDPIEARRRAMAEFGGVERYKEEVRDARGTRFLEGTRDDVFYAWRGLRRRPLFALATMLTLGIGLGAATAVFSWANRILLRPIPGVQAPEELVNVRFAKSDFDDTGISWPNLHDYRRGVRSFALMSGYATFGVEIGPEGAPSSPAGGIFVDDNYFSLVDVRPAHGRLFSPEELDPATTPNVAIISDRLWRASFAASRTIVGRRVRLNATDFTIIGVLPRNFRGLTRTGEGDVWMPLSAYPVVRHAPQFSIMDRTKSILMSVVGRLRPVATFSEAQLELRAKMKDLRAAFPGEIGGTENYAEYLPTVATAFGRDRLARPSVMRASLLLGGVVTLVLLIAVSNAANLLLLRSTRRRSEYALRHAIGASAGRLLRQHLAEGAILAGFSALVGIIVAIVMAKLFQSGVMGMPGLERLEFDRRVVVAAILLTLLVGLLIGLAPALVSHRRSLMRHLKSEARTAPSKSRARSTLTVIQLAASLALVICSLLLAISLRGLHGVSPGFNPDGLMLFGVSADAQGYSQERYQQLGSELLQRAQNSAGITAAALSSGAPFLGTTFNADLRTPGETGKTWKARAGTMAVSPDYFRTMGIRILAGRTFTEQEYATELGTITVISRSAAKAVFGTADVVGRDLVQRSFKGPLTQTIIGVVDDIRGSEVSLRGEGELAAYQTSLPAFTKTYYLLVRGTLPPAQIERQLRKQLAAIDPSLRFIRNTTMLDQINASLATIRLFARLIGVLSLLAIGLAGVGLYSVIAFGVSERIREIGIRMALGAASGNVVALIVRRAALLAGIGIVIGCGMALLLTRMIESHLFGISRLDPVVYLAGAALIMVLTLMASILPARSAARIMPAETLRSD